jgi:YaiO family outer membrane protein
MMRNTRRSLQWVAVSLACAASAAGAQETAVKATQAPVTSVSGEISLVSFSGDTDPWRLASVALWRRSSAGTFIARVNYANRFATDGLQVEADAYPRVSDKVYLYFNAGYSGATVFPAWRFGTEAFTALPSAWEASVGVRQLRFNGLPVTMLTGAVGRYVGNYWFSLRPYVRNSDGTTSATTTFQARRYFADADHWLGASVTYGGSPTERITPDAVALTRTFGMAVNGSTGLTPGLLATWLIGHDAERLSPGNTRRSVTVTVGLRRML